MDLCKNCHEQVNKGLKPWLIDEGEKKHDNISNQQTTEVKEPAKHLPTTECEGCHIRYKTTG